ncbi:MULTISPECIES: MATE family efflux transporter [Bifidobacterium]|uniref:MATE family efflux transporter n=1 Tax=Bifidobacterium TaxID=1678 RepID=UPI001BDC97AF|nr:MULTISPECIES: MATE family efflux transporter [Bifidobacterium]MBT1162490.1 MATE family efflux transporter [Bifidobacterium sp. SO1]MBW3079316.1 MATE family efflux transporter [Bifidobacterium simiiventris]
MATATRRRDADNDLGTKPIGRLAVSLAIPAVVAQACNALYTIVDRLFLAHIPGVGDLAMTGVGVCFPITLAVSAFAMLIGMGGGPLSSIALGRGDRDKADRYLGTSVAAIITIAIVLSVLLQLFKTPILVLFGASDATLPYASGFLSIYLTGTLFVQLSLGLNTFITAQGRALVAMASVIIGALSSLALDPLFIFVFGLGVRGAALANVIAQGLSAAWVIRFLASPDSMIRLRTSNIRLTRLLGPILFLGVSPFIMQITESVIQVVFNSSLQRYGGDVYVGSMTIMTSLMQLIFVFSQGISQGVQPIIGYNYGAGLYGRVRRAYSGTMVVQVAINCTMTTLLALFPGSVASLFTTDGAIIGVVSRTLPYFVCGMGVFGIQNVVQCAFVGMGQAKPSLFLAVFRKLILLVPLALALPRLGFGTTGVFIAEPISDITSAIVAGLLFAWHAERLLPKTAMERK